MRYRFPAEVGVKSTTPPIQPESGPPRHVAHFRFAAEVRGTVSSLDAAIQWYEMTLGFTLVERRVTSGEHSGMLSAVMRAGRAIVVLVQGTLMEPQSIQIQWLRGAFDAS